VAIGTEATQFPEKEYINRIFLAVLSLFKMQLSSANTNRMLLPAEGGREIERGRERGERWGERERGRERGERWGGRERGRERGERERDGEKMD
jgi:hypothetical protein